MDIDRTTDEADSQLADQAGAEAQLVEAFRQIRAEEHEQRQWLRSIVPILQLTPTDPPPSDRVQFALDQLAIAAAERAVRILGSDVSDENNPCGKY